VKHARTCQRGSAPCWRARNRPAKTGHGRTEVAGMRITAIRDIVVPIKSNIANAFIDFSR
jgi:hypothetical protein